MPTLCRFGLVDDVQTQCGAEFEHLGTQWQWLLQRALQAQLETGIATRGR